MAKFHIRARTIDLLGRQQIANISTAISELFKNAHDAYANFAEVDFFRDDGLFVLRDDGLGMTRVEFEQRWLTIGTDSKVGSFAGLSRPPTDATQELRPLLGEKGIGRLAIAVIGRQVLVLTRARVAGIASDEITAAYIHWGLFELPGIDLNEIIIPLETFAADALPDADDIKKMVATALTGLDQISNKISPATLLKIRSDMVTFQVNPREAATYLQGPTFNGDGTGTHFYILPADEIIKDDIDGRDDDNKATRFEKNLIGFTNTMTPDFTPPKIVTRFRDHVDEGEASERLGEKAFFSPDEFKKVDHHIRGSFDKFGQFRGKVGVYQTEPTDYVLNWANTDGRETACGPFEFSIAVIQPTLKDSLVEPTEHALIRRKLERHGGVYIYKDGIRVQPYGGTENDFLDVERRRNQRAGTYYYSFRNMMGAIELNSENNPNLVEKAGREGFREDKAYRQFRSILINFFIQSAADFFVEQGRYADEWAEKRFQLQHLDEVRKNREKNSKNKKNKFSQQLESFFLEVDRGGVSKKISDTISTFEEKLNAEISRSKKSEAKAFAIGRLEADAKDEIARIRKSIIVSKPRGVGLNKELMNNWLAYQNETNRLVNQVIHPSEKKIEFITSSTIEKYNLNLNPSLRLTAAARKITDEAVNSIKSLRVSTEATLTEVNNSIRELTKSSFRKVNKVADEILTGLAGPNAETQGEFDFSQKREELEIKVTSVLDEETENLRKLSAQLEAIIHSTLPRSENLLEVTEALEEEVTALRERQDRDLELAQIGMALNTINHEFSKTAGGLRDGFRRLKSWANANPDLARLYNDMRASFDHLDNYLSLFNPLDRRLQQDAVDIPGFEIFRFLSELFEKRLARHRVTLTASDEFKNFRIRGYQADFYPVFVNLIDNSIYWSSNGRNEHGLIELSVSDGDICIKDNGRGVSRIDVNNIFEMNFTRKPGGRGMGLNISKQVLQRLGYELSLDPPEFDSGACFRISKLD